MAITFFGVASTPADNGTQAGPGPVAVTPPSNMQEGDLVLVYAFYNGGSSTNYPRIFDSTNVATEHGGQGWNIEKKAQNRLGLFWCRFNGTWSANPSFRVGSGTNGYTVVMLVFRPSASSKYWRLDKGPFSAFVGAPGSPFTVTISGVTTIHASTVSVAAWAALNTALTWGSLSGSGWEKTSLAAQYRNTTTGSSITCAYQIKTSAGATNDVSQNESVSDGSVTLMASFAEFDPPTGGTVASPAYVQSAGTSAAASASTIAVSLSAITAGNAVVGYVHWEDVQGDTGSAINTISDNGGNTDYIPVIGCQYHELAQKGMIFWLPNVQGNPTTITANFAGSVGWRGLIVAEITGIGSLGKVTAVDWRPQGNTPETMSTPAVTPGSNGHYFFGAVHNASAPQQDTDWFNQVSPWTERREVLGNISNNVAPLAIHEYIQATAAARDFDVQSDIFDGHILCLATFAPAVAAGGPSAFKLFQPRIATAIWR